MSDIIIEGKNLKDIDQSNFQSVGPYTDDDQIQVREQWQGRNKISEDEDTDLRFKLGTYTENDRDFWEIQTTNPVTRLSQFESDDIKTARSKIVIRSDSSTSVVPDEVKWSVDMFPYVVNTDNNETVPLYFYYDKDLHPSEYNAAVNGKVNFKIELRASGRDQDGIIDNFLERQAIRPFVLGFSKNNYGTDADGLLTGDGSYVTGDRVVVQAFPNPTSYFEQWTDGITSTSNPRYFDMPNADINIVANFRPNPIIRFTSRVNGTVDETAAKLFFGNLEELQQISQNLQNLQVGNLLEQLEDIEILSSFQEKNIFRPNQNFLMVALRQGREFLLENFSLVSTTGETIFEIQGENDQGFFNFQYSSGSVEGQPQYQDGIANMYANYTLLHYNFRSWNNWAPTQPQGQGLVYYLSFGYGDLNINDDSAIEFGQELVDTDLIIQPVLSDGYLISDGQNRNFIRDFLYYQVDSVDATPPSIFEMFTNAQRITVDDLQRNFQEGVVISPSEANDAIIIDTDGVNGGRNSSITMTTTLDQSGNFIEPINQIIGNPNSYHYLGYVFKQLGTYIKLTQTTDYPSTTYNLIQEPDNGDILRNESDSPEIEAPMYRIFQINQELDPLVWKFDVNVSTKELPVLEKVIYWDQSILALVESSPESLPENMEVTLEQEPGEENFATKTLTYQRPNNPPYDGMVSFVDAADNFYKYIEFVIRTDWKAEPFRGIFELIFSTSPGLGSLTLDQQSRYIGRFGETTGVPIDTPTYAHTLDEWLNNTFEDPLNITTQSNRVRLESVTVEIANNFVSILENILQDNYFNNYSETVKEIAVQILSTSYLELRAPKVGSTDTFSHPVPSRNLIIAKAEGNENNDVVEDILGYIDQNLNVPRLPINITSNFIEINRITINFIGNFFAITTNWDQDAYMDNRFREAVDTWTTPLSSALPLEENAEITVPSTFFNGIRKLRIKSVADPTFVQQESGDDEPSPSVDISPSGTFGTGINIVNNTDVDNSVYEYIIEITGLDRNITIIPSWNIGV